MPLGEIRLEPGLDVEETATYDKAAYVDITYGRFKAGLFQKLGGWQKYYPLAIDGEGKALHAWQDLNNNKRLAIGTTTGLFALNSALSELSPQTLETEDDPDFESTASDATIEITDTNISNVTPDDSVYFRTPVSIGGIILSGLYSIATRTSATSYTIEAQANASKTRANLTITDITQANPGVVTYSGADNIAEGDLVYIFGVGGMAEVNGTIQTVTNLDTGANTFEIEDTSTFTPYTTGGTLSFAAVPMFTTTSGESAVSVTLQDHAQSVGNDVILDLPTVVGGITIQGRYSVTSVTNADVFVITANEAASSSAVAFMNDGQVALTYYIALGPRGGGSGYGLADYGEGPYGIGGTTPDIQEGTALVVTDWTLDNWGEILLAGAENGGIYSWGPTSGFQNMSVIETAPLFNTGMFVSMAQQQVIAYGSSISARDFGGIGIYQDPLLVAYSNVSDFTNWTATVTTQAGNFRIPTGSEIVGAGATPNRNLIWTDLECWAMTYLGYPLIYSFNKIGSNCGLIGKHAWAQLGNGVFWMGKSNFFMYTGSGVQPLPCSVWDFVFQDLDQTNAHKCVAASNTDFTEVWFFFPSASGGLGYPDKYVKLNIVENTWDAGPMSRLAWIDRSVLGAPIAIGGNTGLLYQHETGYDADTEPLTPSFTTGFFYLDEGQNFFIVDQIIPDMKWGSYGGDQDAQVMITINAVETPGETPVTYGPFLMTQATQYIDCRIRARQISVTVSSSDSGSFWRLGLLRFRFAPDGRR